MVLMPHVITVRLPQQVLQLRANRTLPLSLLQLQPLGLHQPVATALRLSIHQPLHCLQIRPRSHRITNLLNRTLRLQQPLRVKPTVLLL
jgi:hypothetical protein